MTSTLLLGIALIALLISMAAHILSFFGIALVRESGALGLHFGVLILGLAAATVIHVPIYRCEGGARDFWRKHLPGWIRVIWVVLFAHALVTIIWALLRKFTGPDVSDEVAGRALANRAFSAGWMFLYALLSGLFYATFDYRFRTQKENV